MDIIKQAEKVISFGMLGSCPVGFPRARCVTSGAIPLWEHTREAQTVSGSVTQRVWPFKRAVYPSEWNKLSRWDRLFCVIWCFCE